MYIKTNLKNKTKSVSTLIVFYFFSLYGFFLLHHYYYLNLFHFVFLFAVCVCECFSLFITPHQKKVSGIIPARVCVF